MSYESFPNTRLRRTRKAEWIRDLVTTTTLSPSDLILPLFVIPGKDRKELIKSLPDVFRFSSDLIVKQAKEAYKLGIPALMLFPITEEKLKTNDGREAWNRNNLICQTISEIKNAVPDIGIICDVALDPYTSHGHDGVTGKNGEVLNDETIEVLCKQSLAQVRAGCDAIAPSDMMDGRIGVIRKFLDQNSFSDTAIISYAAKYASSFYGPFRDAVKSAGNLKKSDKKTYQMDFRNSNEAMREIALDISEGADMVIIKPGMPYLDIVAKAQSNFQIPIISYQVSGEYSMMRFAAENGALDFNSVMMESLIGFKRAGCCAIISYWAKEAAKILR
jgi:porphobilinogen synthase